MGDIYTQLAERFDDQTGLSEVTQSRTEELFDRLDVLLEEVDELEEAIEVHETVSMDMFHSVADVQEQEAAVVEELADVLVTAFTMADVLDYDITHAYGKKMEYNLEKSGDRVEDGKVVDDADIEKPDFRDCLPAEKPCNTPADTVRSILDSQSVSVSQIQQQPNAVMIDLDDSGKLHGSAVEVLEEQGFYVSGVLDREESTRFWIRKRDESE